MQKVSAGSFDILRAGYVIGDVLDRRCGKNWSSEWWTTSVGTRIVGRTARTSPPMRAGVMSENSRARRQAFVTAHDSPDLLVPRHVRIHHMHEFACAPRCDHEGPEVLGIEGVNTLTSGA